MTTRKRRLVQQISLICIAHATLSPPDAVHAQADAARTEPESADSVAGVHATLRGWDERSWLTIFDRGGSFFGRTSDRGILQRFNRKMDTEYLIDVISFSPSLTETYTWYQRDSGLRAWVGSINHLQLIQQAQFKATIPLGETWATRFEFTFEDNLRAQRSLIRLGFEKVTLGERARAFGVATVKAEKPDSDIELGFAWTPEAGEVTFAVAALDLFNDVIFQGLEVSRGIADSTLDYTSHPFTARVALDMKIRRDLRVEAYGLAMTPTRVVVESQAASDEGFVQDERYAYAGGLLEWSPSVRSAIGAYGTWARARLGRSPLLAGRPRDDFDLTERTWQLGLLGITRLGQRFTVEAWLAHVWRTEERVRPDTTVAPDIDYEDQTWAGRGSVTYRANSGFSAELGLDIAWRDIVSDDRLPGAFDEDHSRLRFDLGWQFGQRASFVLGTNVDLDGDHGTASGAFDGGHGRIAFFW